MSDQPSKKPEKPELKIIPGLETENPFDPANISLQPNEILVGQKVLLRVPARKPDRTEFFRTNPDPELCIPTVLLLYDNEYYLVSKTMRGGVPEAQPHELRLCVSRGGAPFWWPIRLPGEDGKTYLWWDTAREIANLAKERWVRCYADRSANMYAAVVVPETVTVPEPKWPDLPVSDLLHLGFSDRLIDSHDHHVLKILRGEV